MTFYRLITLLVTMAGLLQSTSAAADETWLLSGSTLYPPLPEADVIVHIGSAQHLTSTDEDGHYQLDIQRPDDDELIAIEIQGSGVLKHIRFARLVGSAVDLKPSKAAPSVVRIGPVSPMSTALFILMEHHSGGQLPVAFSSLEHQLLTLDVTNQYHLTVLSTALAAGLVDLNNLAGNTLDLLRDPDAVFDRLGSITSDTDVWDESHEIYHEQTSNDPAMFREVAWNWPIELIELRTSLGRESATRLSSGDDDVLWLERYFYDGPVLADDMPCSHCISADRFELEPFANRRLLVRPPADTELVMRTANVRPDPEAPEVYSEDHLDWKLWHFYDASDSISLGRLSHHVTQHYPENPEFEPVPYSSSLGSSLAYRSDHLPESWETFSGQERWLLPLCAFNFDHIGDPAYSDIFGEDLVQFQTDGSAYAERLDMTFQWSWDGNDLVLDGTDRPQARLRYLGNDGRADLLLVRCQADDSSRMRSMVRRAVKLTDPLPSIEELLPARFVSGFNLQPYLPTHWFFRGWPVMGSIWVIELQADGTGAAGNVRTTSDSPSTTMLNWEQDDNGLIKMEISYSNPESYRSRSWLPLRIQDGELTVLESLFMQPWDDEAEELTQPGRYNWYRVISED